MKNIIENEKFSLERMEEKLKDLEVKWIKLPSTDKVIKFLEFYCENKKEFIKELEKQEKELK